MLKNRSLIVSTATSVIALLSFSTAALADPSTIVKPKQIVAKTATKTTHPVKKTLKKTHYQLSITKNGKVIVNTNGYIDTSMPLTYQDVRQISYIGEAHQLNERSVKMKTSYAELGQTVTIHQNKNTILLSISMSKLLNMKHFVVNGLEISLPKIKTIENQTNLIIPKNHSQTITINGETIKVTHL